MHLEVLTNEYNSILIKPGHPDELVLVIEIVPDNNMRKKLRRMPIMITRKYTMNKIGDRMIHYVNGIFYFYLSQKPNYLNGNSRIIAILIPFL